MKEYDAKVRLNEEDGGKTGELDIMLKPPFDKGYFKGVTYGIEFKEPVFEAEKKSGWIPCSEQLPSDAIHVDDMVLVCYKNGSIRFNSFMDGQWVQGNPIAWMPIPEPYEMGE